MRTNLPIYNRRRFLQNTVATATCHSALNSWPRDGLARPIAANDANHGNIIDTHVYLGRWPLRRLAEDVPSQLVAMLRSNHVSQAWTGSFDGLFHKDVHGANLRLVEACRIEGDGLLVPFGTINPTLPDWEEDIRRCHEDFKVPGVRLHPNYHGYTLDDPRFARLLELASARKLLVQVVAWMTDERHPLLTPRVPQVDLSPLAKIVQPMRRLRLVVSNGLRTARDKAVKSLAPLTHVCFDIARISDGSELRNLRALVSVERVMFGSTAPLSGFESIMKTLEVDNATADQIRAIRRATAQRLLNANNQPQ